MKKSLFLFVFLMGSLMCYSQYNKEKLSTLLTGGSEKVWIVTGINAERAEQKMIFNKNNSVKVQFIKEQEKTVNWSLKSSDDIRWFILIGDQNYELIVSYDKKGNEYLKLTHQSLNGNDEYQMKLNPVK
jgi:hypothetical protein